MRPKAAGYCIALAELSSHTGQTESHMQWSYIPMEPQHPSPGRTAFKAANKHNHRVLISSLEAPAASAPAAANWSESMIQQKNSLFMQSPAVTLRFTVEREGVWPCSNGDSSLSGLKTSQAASSSPTSCFTPPGKPQS